MSKENCVKIFSDDLKSSVGTTVETYMSNASGAGNSIGYGLVALSASQATVLHDRQALTWNHAEKEKDDHETYGATIEKQAEKKQDTNAGDSRGE